MRKMRTIAAGVVAATAGLFAAGANATAMLDIDFNSGLSNFAGGDLTYTGVGGFEVTFTDDDSAGGHGNANGVHVTNLNYGNIKVGNQTDFVLGAFNNFVNSSNNLHSSGIVAMFNQGVEMVSLFDSDNDGTAKTLFAFDINGNVIGQDGSGTFGVDSQRTFSVSLSDTGGQLIHSVEFDTQVGALGGSNDGTVFTIDDFSVQYSVSEPVGLLLLGSALPLVLRRRLGQK